MVFPKQIFKQKLLFLGHFKQKLIKKQSIFCYFDFSLFCMDVLTQLCVTLLTSSLEPEGNKLDEFGFNTCTSNSLENALKKADDKIPLLITGSLYLAGYALKFNETIIN